LHAKEWQVRVPPKYASDYLTVRRFIAGEENYGGVGHKEVRSRRERKCDFAMWQVYSYVMWLLLTVYA